MEQGVLGEGGGRFGDKKKKPQGFKYNLIRRMLMEIKGREPVSVIQVDSNVKSKIHFLTGEEAKLSATTGLLPEEKQIKNI